MNENTGGLRSDVDFKLPGVRVVGSRFFGPKFVVVSKSKSAGPTQGKLYEGFVAGKLLQRTSIFPIWSPDSTFPRTA